MSVGDLRMCWHRGFFVFVFYSNPPRPTALANFFFANLGYRPTVDFGNLGLEGGLSILESVLYACPGCVGAP